MRVLFDVTHPAHVHLFKHAIKELESKGHEVLVTSREKDLTTDLLDAYEIAHSPISVKGENTISLITEWMTREVRMISTVRSFNPDVIVSRLNPTAAHASVIARCPSIVFDDSEIVRFARKITHPFADVVCTPANFDRELGNQQKRYEGFHELAYLHPDRFTPDPDALREYGVEPEDHYAVLRFVSWDAHHDITDEGLSYETKQEIIDKLAQEGDVYITSEMELPAEFEEYRLPIPPELVHQLLFYANIYTGDSQTMATEAAILGTPAVRSNTFAMDDDMSNFVRLESEYELLYSTDDEEEAIEIINDVLTTPNLKAKWNRRREALISDTIDVTEYLLDVIYNETVNDSNASSSWIKKEGA